MFKFLSNLLYNWGKSMSKSHDTYEPQHDGQWKNKGTDKNEQWVWVEQKPTAKYVNVFNIGDDYIITIGDRRKGNAVESYKCRDEREVQIALDLASVYYGTLGHVSISTEAE
jgi:hypothetical protein